MGSITKFWPLALGALLFALAVSHRARLAVAIDVDQVQADAAVMTSLATLVSSSPTPKPPEPTPTPTPTPDGKGPSPKPVPKVSLAVFEYESPTIQQVSNPAPQVAAPTTKQAPKIEPQKYVAPTFEPQPKGVPLSCPDGNCPQRIVVPKSVPKVQTKPAPAIVLPQPATRYYYQSRRYWRR